MSRVAIAFFVFFFISCGSVFAQQQPPPPSPQIPAPLPTPAPAVRPANVAVVLDPGHGGADAGARGAGGILEKEVALQFAQSLRAELVRQGLQVLLTRQGDENPSFDDRAILANAYRGAVFITVHVSSTGTAGTARSYYLTSQLSAAGPLPSVTVKRPAPSAADQAGKEPEKPEVKEPEKKTTEEKAPGLARWEEAQQPFVESSRKLAELVQTQLKQKFASSPATPAAGSLRQLRSVALPAVAVEISSVSVADRKQLDAMAPGVAEAVARAVMAFRASPAPQAGAR